MKPRTDTAYDLRLGPARVALVETRPTPRTVADRCAYRSLLKTLLDEQLKVELLAEGDPAPWRDFAVRACVSVPVDSRLEFTGDGWARLAIHLVPSGRKCRPLSPLELATWNRCVPDQVPLLARLSSAVDGSLLALEWRLPEAPPPGLRAEASTGALSSLFSADPLRLSIPAQAPSASAGCVAEVGAAAESRQIPAPAPRGARRPRFSPPARLTVSSLCRDSSSVPLVRCSGGWLARLGFTEGERIAVTAAPGRIVLTLHDPAAPPAAPSGQPGNPAHS
jgi:hypothetical protein